MAIHLHHFFVITEPGAPEAKLLADIGLVEGSSNVHAGQGTANRRFFFANSMLELLYVHDPKEALHGRGKGLQFVQRQADAAASPFGLILNQDSPAIEPAFPGWPYCPTYFPDDQCFHVGENSSLLQEPLCICMPAKLQIPDNKTTPDNPRWLLTELRISVPVVRPSQTLQAIAKCPNVSLCLNQPHRLELVFNNGKEGRSKDINPDLPLVLHW